LARSVATILSFLDRYLTGWIFLAMIAGVGLGYLLPELITRLNELSQIDTTSVPLVALFRLTGLSSCLAHSRPRRPIWCLTPVRSLQQPMVSTNGAGENGGMRVLGVERYGSRREWHTAGTTKD